MTEFTYQGKCGNCFKLATFWGGSSKCWCDICGMKVNPKGLTCTGMW